MKEAQSRLPHFLNTGVRHATINGHRLHLRTLDPTQQNYLWIDGRQPPIILDPTAADFVAFFIEGMWRYQCGAGDESQVVIDYVVARILEKYRSIPGMSVFQRMRISPRRVRADLDRIVGTIMAIAEGGCPTELTMGPKEIEFGTWVSPARLDLAVTWGCNLRCKKCYFNPDPSVSVPLRTELSTGEWIKVLGLAWQVGIPQVVFTGGEPTLRPDLVELVSNAQEFVTGLVTNGTRLAKNSLAQQLVAASLDYAQITIESNHPDIHDFMTQVPGSHVMTVDGIKAALQAGLQVTTNTTLTKANALQFLDTMKFLAGLGVRSIACNTLICSGRGTACKTESGLDDSELNQVLVKAIELADSLGVELQWYSPTCYGAGINPIQLGFGVKGCSAAAHNMTVQPNGDVLPCQSWPQPVGNMLRDQWKAIWDHPICSQLRAHSMKSSTCQGCVYENMCGGGCPLDNSPRIKCVPEQRGAA